MPEPDFPITSLRGGLNDTDPPNAITPDQVVQADNVEFFYSMLGERRLGCEGFSVAGSVIDGTNINEPMDRIVYIGEWFPSNDVRNPEYLAIGSTPGVQTITAKWQSGVWTFLDPDDPIISTIPDIYQIQTQALNGQLFISYPSAENRLHVLTGNTIRRTGLTQPFAAPTGANTGTGTFNGLRYYRIRYIEMGPSGVIKRRSEPSETLTMWPSGAGTGIIVTRPALVGEGETHWELEASTDNANFYRDADHPVLAATTTATDSTDYATGYAGLTLSEGIGDYLTLPSFKYLTVDGDRLVMAGHWTDPTMQSRVAWTPTFSDEGAGNSERLPLTIDNQLDLDNYSGGSISGIAAGLNGDWYAFKWARIYKMVRTGDVTDAYQPVILSNTLGALPGSVVSGVDARGAAAIYFLDPKVGPAVLGPGGIQLIPGQLGTWSRIHIKAADVIACAVHYPAKQQIWWWIAVDGSDSPNLLIKWQIGGGWVHATGRITEAYTAALITELVSIDGVVTMSHRPFIGLSTPDFLQRCDAGIDDAGVPFRGMITTQPYLPAGLLNRWGSMTAAALGTAVYDTVDVSFVRDFGLETVTRLMDCTPVGTEEFVIRAFDDLAMSNAIAIQVQLSDPEDV